MSTYGAVHELVVEHEDQGRWDDDPQEKGRHDVWMSEVRYILRHPSDGCWESSDKWVNDHEICPIVELFDNVGVLDALGVTQWKTVDGRFQVIVEHLQDGLYQVQCWQQHYSSPNGDDWDGGLYVERVEQPPPLPRQGASRWTLEPVSSSPPQPEPEKPESSTPSS